MPFQAASNEEIHLFIVAAVVSPLPNQNHSAAARGQPRPIRCVVRRSERCKFSGYINYNFPVHIWRYLVDEISVLHPWWVQLTRREVNKLRVFRLMLFSGVVFFDVWIAGQVFEVGQIMVMKSEGFKHLEQSCPSLLSGLLETVALADEKPNLISGKKRKGRGWPPAAAE
ncbi:hypothetical protein SASPL_110995 [Salvia splendens]|uniref:Uncharacterized protein n=1 Tax=Salvia splendens TaxID=180675 RepID=A0A8X9A3W0_SALSN|nr:hypothetical protein SASPL_110995 [Salvia splendens]